MEILLVVRLVAIVIALTFLPVPGAEAQQDHVGELEPGVQGAVTYDKGDFWKYRQVSTPARKPPTPDKSFEIYVKELGAARFQLYGDEVLRQAWRMKWFVNTTNDVSAASNFPVDSLVTRQSQDRWYLTVDDPDWPLAEAESTSRIESNVPGYEGMRSDAEYRPPLHTYVFPFTVGDEWVTITKRVNTDYQNCPGGQPPCNSQTPLQYHYKVLREEPVRIEHSQSLFSGQSYDAYVVQKIWLNAATSHYELLWYVPEFCGHVKREDYQASQQGAVTELYFREWLMNGKCSQRVPDSQPTYYLDDSKNFSATQLHGEVELPGSLGEAERHADGQSLGEALVNDAPASALLAPLALLGAALVAARRRR